MSVSKVALDWLFGRAPDHEGHWFSDTDYRPNGNFWWRRRFDEINRLPSLWQGRGEDVTATKKQKRAAEYWARCDRLPVLLPGVICERCGATLGNYSDKCPAELTDPCPGFMAIERALAAPLQPNPKRGE